MGPIAFPVMTQTWELVSFLHWPYAPATMRPLVPAPFELDLYSGWAWVGLVAFRMTVRPLGLPPVPRLSRFPETSVRTYVRGPDGRPGVWFLSLDVDSLWNAATGRLLGLPYRWSRMGIACGEEELRYSCSLRSPMRSVSSSVSVRPGTRTIPQTDLDRFLTARFVLFGIGPLGEFSVPVEHNPWHLMAADGDVADDELVTTTGLPAPPEAPLIHYSPGVSVRVGMPSLVRETPV